MFIQTENPSSLDDETASTPQKHLNMLDLFSPLRRQETIQEDSVQRGHHPEALPRSLLETRLPAPAPGHRRPAETPQGPARQVPLLPAQGGKAETRGGGEEEERGGEEATRGGGEEEDGGDETAGGGEEEEGRGGQEVEGRGGAEAGEGAGRRAEIGS